MNDQKTTASPPQDGASSETPGAAQTVTAENLFTPPPAPTAHVVNGPAGASTPETPAATPQPASAAAGPVLPPKTDRRGVPFDAEKHLDVMHPKSGAWMPKKPKRPEQPGSSLGRGAAPKETASTLGPDAGTATPETASAAGDVAPGDAFKAASLAACTILYSVGMTIGGDEWRPSQDEHAALSTSFEGYFRAKGIKDLSPGWALAIAVVAYAGPRFRQPKTLSTLQKLAAFGHRVGAWWRRRSTINAIPAGIPTGPTASQIDSRHAA